MTNNVIIKLYRQSARICERLFGFDSGFAFYLRSKVYDWNDYTYGPSMLAEKSAQRTGYWNLEAAELFLSSVFHYEENKPIKDLLRPLIYKKYQVRKYN